MQDQGKRLLLAMVLGLGVYLVWFNWFREEEPKPPAQTHASGSNAASGATAPSSSVIGTKVSQVGPAWGAPSASSEAPPAAAAPPLVLPFDRFTATFSSSCGGLVSWKLKDPRYAKDTTGGELMPVREHAKFVDHNEKPLPASAPLPNLPACGAFDVNFVAGTSTYVVPRGAIWKEEQRSPTEVRYSWSDSHLEIIKDFTVAPETYVVRMAVKVIVHAVAGGGEVHQQLAITSYAYQDPAEVKNGSSRVAARAWSSSSLRDGDLITTEVTEVIKAPRFEPSASHPAATLHWTGYDHPYLLAGYAPAVGDRFLKQTFASDGTDGRPNGFMQTDMVFPVSTFRPGDASLNKVVVAYLGPKNYDDLQKADVAAGFHTGFDKVIDLGWFAFIGRPLLWLLQKFWSFAGNWGISIILLTIVVKALTLYWTTKSMRSMKAMAALAPQMKALQAKYADDKQRQQTETMALYKEHGVNPVAGCLPILLQMPVWIALYRMLANAGELYLQPFIPGWINDLTNTDPYYVLPAVLFVTMFLQARLQPATADSTQQKFLQYGMPIMFGVMAFIFPAGLTLYMLTNNVLSALHSIYMNKFDKKSLASAAQLKKNQDLVAAAAAAAAGAAKPGGGAGKKTSTAAKRVIDAKATEVADGAADRDDGGDESDDASEAAGAAASPGAGAARNRPRRKKRRR